MRKRVIAAWLIVFCVTLVAADQRPLTFEDMFRAGRLSSLAVAPDGSVVAFVVTTPDLQTNSFQRDIYMADIDGDRVVKLSDSQGQNYAPRFMDNHRISFISTRGESPQIYRLDIRKPGEITRVTGEDIPGGAGDYIWLPGATALAFQADVYPDARSLEESVARQQREAEDDLQVRVLTSLMYRVWNAWKEGRRSHIFLHRLDDGTYRDLTPGDYDTPPVDLGGRQDFVFSPDGKRFAYVKNTDPMVAVSTNNDIFIKSLQGDEEVNLTAANHGNDMNPLFSPSGEYLAYLSMKRAGFEADKKEIILLDIAAGATKNLTADFTYNVNEIVFSPDNRYLYFSVTESIYHPIYRVALRTGKIRKLVDRVYASDLTVCPSGRYLLFFNQSVTRPREVYRFDLRSKNLSQLTKINEPVFAGVAMNPAERFRFTGAGDDMVEGIMVKPPFFSADKKYPMVFLVHGGPQGAWGDDFHFRWNLSMFASPGYVVVAINFHGSRGYGQDFTDAVSRDWGGAPFVDLVRGQAYVVENYPFIDGQRIVAAGASYGGYMVNWIAGNHDRFQYPFRCLVSHDGIFDARSMYYSTEELWFEEWEHGGTPWESDLYEKFNPALKVENFSVPMLIIHGEKDFRVPVSQGLMLFTALQRRGIPSKLLYYPDEDHFVRKPKNARFWWQSVFDWFATYLK